MTPIMVASRNPAASRAGPSDRKKNGTVTTKAMAAAVASCAQTALAGPRGDASPGEQPGRKVEREHVGEGHPDRGAPDHRHRRGLVDRVFLDGHELGRQHDAHVQGHRDGLAHGLARGRAAPRRDCVFPSLHLAPSSPHDAVVWRKTRPPSPRRSRRRYPAAILLAMAMFVLVVDTSLMNVSISAVVEDLDTTVSGVQSAIALEALVSAAFILIGSKVGDLIGRKRAYVLGLLGYAVGALAMTLAQSLTAIIIFWAIIGGLGASLLLPAMQSLIHGNFEGAAQKKVYALVGAAAAIAAAVGPLLGGFITTYLSWRVGFLSRS